jgi:DNA-binding Xre family transcriptional regulator
MARNDGLDLVRALLSMALVNLPISPRQIEDALQIGHGTLPRLLDGRMDLKLHHLLPLCKVLKIHPGELLQRGLPHWRRLTASTTGCLLITARRPGPPLFPTRSCKRSAPWFVRKSPATALHRA